MDHQKLSPWQYSILGLCAVSAPLGDTCLSRGMTGLPAISLAHPGTLIAAVFTPWVAFGIVLLITIGVGFVAQGPSLTERPVPVTSVEEEVAQC